VTLLDDSAIESALADSAWRREGNELVLVAKRRDFRDAIAFVNAVADEAERLNHHPDICIRRYRTVELRLTSHDAGGITKRDLALARAIDGLSAPAP
jgi:4a-hydroxytetrahydrobiopterin dehydratase